MGLFNVFKKKERVLTIDDVQEKFFASMSEYTGWKILKSQSCLRKRIGNIVFDICFYSSKYNLSGEHIEANCEFEFWNREFDKICSVNSKIGFAFFQADNDYWYDMTTETKLNDAIVDIKKKFDDYVIPLIEVFEKDYYDAITYLSTEEMRGVYQLDKFEVFEKMQDNKCKHYEWDKTTFVIPKEFQLDINSELADALNVFWTSGGLDFFNVNDSKYYSSNWLEFMGMLYSKIVNGEFVAIDKTYHVPLSDDQKEELVRRGVPAVFITDLKN